MKQLTINLNLLQLHMQSHAIILMDNSDGGEFCLANLFWYFHLDSVTKSLNIYHEDDHFLSICVSSTPILI